MYVSACASEVRGFEPPIMSNHVSVTTYVFLGLLSATMTGAYDECSLALELIQHYHAHIAPPLHIYPVYLSSGAKFS